MNLTPEMCSDNPVYIPAAGSCDECDRLAQEFETAMSIAVEEAESARNAAERAGNSATSASASAANAQNVYDAVNARVHQKFHQTFSAVTEPITSVAFTPTGYQYNDADNYEVYINGLKLNSSEYTRNQNVITLYTPLSQGNNTLEVVVDGFMPEGGYVPPTIVGDATVSGTLKVEGHITPIGYRNGDYGTKSIASGNSPLRITDTDIHLTAGTWLLVGEVEFPANATGVRHLAWNAGNNVQLASRVTVPASSGGFNTRIQSVTTLNISADTDMALYAFQNSGSAMTVSWYWQIVRIA